MGGAETDVRVSGEVQLSRESAPPGIGGASSTHGWLRAERHEPITFLCYFSDLFFGDFLSRIESSSLAEGGAFTAPSRMIWAALSSLP